MSVISKEVAAKKVQAVVDAPIVSDDAKSPEQIMMRDAKQLQLQTDADTKYDAIVERFTARAEPISIPLLGLVVAFSLMGLSIIFTGLQKKR
jgi:hypothetical protein